MSLSSLLPFKSARGSGDIGKWDGRMFKLELVFISCLISWRLSPWLSAANPSDLSEACRRERRTEWTHTHTHTQDAHGKHTRIYIAWRIQKFKVSHQQMCSFNLNAVTHFNLFTNKQTTSEHVYAPCLGFWVLSVSCFTEGSLYVALPLNGSRNETQAK